MIPTKFPECNTLFGPPEEFEESQVQKIFACRGIVRQGNLDGMPFIVMGYKPTPEELEELKEGGTIYLSIIGDLLPPHLLTTDFRVASQQI